MLAETVKTWQEEAQRKGMQQGLAEGMQQGMQQGLAEGRHEGRQEEAAKLFLLLVNAKFGPVSLDIQEKIRQAGPEQIEKWTAQIFHAETPEGLLNS